MPKVFWAHTFFNTSTKLIILSLNKINWSFAIIRKLQINIEIETRQRPKFKYFILIFQNKCHDFLNHLLYVIYVSIQFITSCLCINSKLLCILIFLQLKIHCFYLFSIPKKFVTIVESIKFLYKI